MRIGTRLARRPPPLPPGIRGLERAGAHAGHALLYALPAAVMAVGWAEVDLGGHGVEWFGIGLPKVFPTADAEGGPADVAELMHMWLAYAMLARRRGARRRGRQAPVVGRPRRHGPDEPAPPQGVIRARRVAAGRPASAAAFVSSP